LATDPLGTNILASWTQEFDNTVTPTNLNYGKVSISETVLTLSAMQMNVSFAPSTCSPSPLCQFQLSNTIWYVCSWLLYGTYDSVSPPFVPEAGVTNFTVTSGSSGYCSSPNFTYVPRDVPFQAWVSVVAVDGSFDTSVSTVSIADALYFWPFIASSWTHDFACYVLTDHRNITIKFPRQIPLALSPSGTSLTYNANNYNFWTDATATIFTISIDCSNNALGGVTTWSGIGSPLQLYALAGVAQYVLWTEDLIVYQVCYGPIAPTSGSAGTVVTVSGTFWPGAPNYCVFGGTSVTATFVNDSAISCAAPATTDGSGSFKVTQSGIDLQKYYPATQPTFTYPGQPYSTTSPSSKTPPTGGGNAGSISTILLAIGVTASFEMCSQ